jgi:hypothetical protein
MKIELYERSKQESKIHEREGRIYSQLGLKFSDTNASLINKCFSDSEPDANHSLKTQ